MSRPKLQRCRLQVVGRRKLQRRRPKLQHRRLQITGRPKLQRRRLQIMDRRPKLQRRRACRSKGRVLTAKLIEGRSNKPFAAMRNCPAKIESYKTYIPKSLVGCLAKRE